MGEPKVKTTEEKNVKIKLMRECLIDGEVCKVGTIHTVEESVAAEFCRSMKGYPPFYGYAPEIGPLMGNDENGKPIPNPMEAKQIVRAIRVK